MKRRIFFGLRSVLKSNLRCYYSGYHIHQNRCFVNNTQLFNEEQKVEEEHNERFISDEEWEEIKNEWDEDDDDVWEDFKIEDDPTSDQFAIGIFSSLFGLSLGVVAYKIYRTIIHHRECAKWGRVKGEITNMVMTGRSGNKIKLSYKYIVGNKILRGKRIRFRIVPVMEGKLNLKNARLGKKVWVYYDGKKPSVSTLIPTNGLFYPDIALFAAVAVLSITFSAFGGRRFFYGLRGLGRF